MNCGGLRWKWLDEFDFNILVGETDLLAQQILCLAGTAGMSERGWRIGKVENV
jgi:hypothetical protein